MNENKQINQIVNTLKGWIQTNANNTGELRDELEGKLLKLERGIKGIQVDVRGGGASDFLALSDTPSTFTGSEGYSLVVNAAGDGVEFVADGQEDIFVVADIAARDALTIGLADDEVSDGDIVKLLDGSIYVWDENTSAYIEITAAGKVTPQIQTGVTALPTTVTPTGFTDYHIYMDTSAGDIDLSALGTVTGVPDGGTLHFHNAGSNSLLWNDTNIPMVYSMELGEILTLHWKADTGVWIIR